MAISKIILNGVTQIDLTADTVAASNLISPNTAHGADGNPITGTASGGVSGTYMFPLVANNNDIYVPTITDFTEIKNAQDVQHLALYGYDIAGAVFAYASYYENYEGYSECVTYGYTLPFSDYDTGGDRRNYGYASIYVTYGYYNGALKTDYSVYKDAYNTSGATATADKILSGYTAYGPNGIIDGTASGGSSTLTTKTITANGTYAASSDSADGYSSVTVNVPDAYDVALSWNGNTEMWEPDKTFAQIQAASATADVFNVTLGDGVHGMADGEYDSSSSAFAYTVEYEDSNTGYIVLDIYSYTSSGLTRIDHNEYAVPATFTTKTITANGTYTAWREDDVDGYEEVTVNVQPSLQAKTNISPTTSSQTITADSGYDGLSSVQINAMPSGSASTPATTITANPSISVNSSGLITATASASQSITPTVSAGYVSSGTAGTVTVSGSATSQLTTQAAATITPTESEQTAVASGVYTTGAVKVGAISSTYVGSGVTTKAAATYHPSTSAQTIAASQYLTGAQTIAAVTTTNLSASNIVSGVTVKVGDASDDDCVASVTGTVVLQSYYTGSSAPSSSTGSDGDLYLQT